MTQTLASSLTPLCPVDEFLKRVDNTAVGLLASDTPTAVPANQLATNANVLAALLDASGLFESAVMMGGKYQAADLQKLYTTACAAQGMMFRIIGDLAWAFLFERRPNKNVPTPPSMARSLEWLELLREGKRIFAFLEAQEATIMHKSDATAAEVRQRNGAVAQAAAYYGVRSDERDNW